MLLRKVPRELPPDSHSAERALQSLMEQLPQIPEDRTVLQDATSDASLHLLLNASGICQKVMSQNSTGHSPKALTGKHKVSLLWRFGFSVC